VFRESYHSAIFLNLLKKGIIKTMDIFVSLGIDGYEAWKQSGFEDVLSCL